MLNRIKRWYQGTEKTRRSHVFEEDPDVPIYIIQIPYKEFHWTARFSRAGVRFYLEHWKWLWGYIFLLAATIYNK